MNDVLISCLMVTHPVPTRLTRLRRTLEDFARQTHANRELVVVIDAQSQAQARPVLEMIGKIGAARVRPVVAGRTMTLGALRNLSWDLAEGDVVCPWDDDDRHHPARLSHQLAALQGAEVQACFLQEFLHLFVEERRLYRVNFRPAPDPVAVNTPMFRRHLAVRYPEFGPRSQKEEDLALFQAIRAHSTFIAVPDQPHLFVYVAHGENTCGAVHHRELVNLLGATQGWLLRNEAGLRAGLAAFDFGVGGVIVTGRNGDAFKI